MRSIDSFNAYYICRQGLRQFPFYQGRNYMLILYFNYYNRITYSNIDKGSSAYLNHFISKCFIRRHQSIIVQNKKKQQDN